MPEESSRRCGVLVTGGAGFIGLHLADHLTSPGGYADTVGDEGR